MKRIIATFSLFGLMLGIIFGAIFMWIISSPSTRLVYRFFDTPPGAILVDIDNTTADWIFIIGIPVLGLILGLGSGALIMALRWRLVGENEMARANQDPT